MARLEYDILHVGPVVARLVPAPDVLEDEKLQRIVSAEWERAVAESQGHLFNGTFLNCVGFERDGNFLVVHAHFDEYKAFYVHRQRRELGLSVYGIGVSGLTRVFEDAASEPGILIAVRSEKMTQYPGALECVPSGTIDKSSTRADGTIDFIAKAVAELEEEAGIPANAVRTARDFAFLHDRNDDSYDLCCLLDVTAPADEVLAGFENNAEYSDPVLVPESALAAFMEAEAERVMPVSKGLAQAYLELRTMERRSSHD